MLQTFYIRKTSILALKGTEFENWVGFGPLEMAGMRTAGGDNRTWKGREQECHRVCKVNLTRTNGSFLLLVES